MCLLITLKCVLIKYVEFFLFSDYPVSVDDHCQQLCHRQEFWGGHDCRVGTELYESCQTPDMIKYMFFLTTCFLFLLLVLCFQEAT